MPIKGGRMYILAFTALCFASGVLGVIAFVSKEDNSADKLRGDQRSWEFDQTARLNQITNDLAVLRTVCGSSEESLKKYSQQIQGADAANERLSVQIIELKRAVESADHKASAASDLSHKALIEVSKQRITKVEGTVMLERAKPNPRKKAVK